MTNNASFMYVLLFCHELYAGLDGAVVASTIWIGKRGNVVLALQWMFCICQGTEAKDS